MFREESSAEQRGAALSSAPSLFHAWLVLWDLATLNTKCLHKDGQVLGLMCFYNSVMSLFSSFVRRFR